MLRLRIAKRRQQPDGARCSCELVRTRSCVHPPCGSRCAIYACTNEPASAVAAGLGVCRMLKTRQWY